MAIFSYVNKKFNIGEIIFDDIIDEISISSTKNNPEFSKADKCIISVMGNEGDNIPHFHIDNKSTGLSVCVKIFENKYFSHGTHKDKLTNRDCIILDKWLSMNNTKYLENNTNWEAIVYLWDNINGDKYLYNNEVIYTADKPDYTKLNKG